MIVTGNVADLNLCHRIVTLTRHGLQNSEMAVLIKIQRSELFCGSRYRTSATVQNARNNGMYRLLHPAG